MIKAGKKRKQINIGRHNNVSNWPLHKGNATVQKN
jgi:hypothetical protein